MKKILIVLGLCSAINLSVSANGLLTNSNQSAAYVRMICRLASLDIDGVYYNPAGLTKLLHDGFHASINTQTIFQTRIITSDLDIMNNHEHKGSMSVPIFPSVYAVYKKGDWAFSFGFNPVAGGGKVDFKNGIPSLEIQAAALPFVISGAGIPTSNYAVNMQFKGSSVYYGVQFNATYQINENFSAAFGIRGVYAANAYEGYMRDIMINPQQPMFNPSGGLMSAPEFFTAAANAYQAMGNPALAAQMNAYASATSDKYADVSQSGFGIAPIIGLNYNYQNLNIGARYEFKTRMETKNKTTVDGTGLFPDGKTQRVDAPAYFTIGASYKVLPKLNVAAGFGYYWDKQAKMHSWDPDVKNNPNDPMDLGNYVRREDFIDNGCQEYSFGLEYNITEKFLVSAGYQYGKVGVQPEYQSDINHTINNHTYGFGGQYKISENIKLNAGFLMTKYVPFDVKMQNPVAASKYTQTYDRRNYDFSVGIDIKF
ncbi:MAG: hypothetical protein LBT56_03210 [Prevotellaceae bacterium]|jgi:long-subunit fatty acid transport protein|nr:hypothetical protein [Prevotellaceae bacterium]